MGTCTELALSGIVGADSPRVGRSRLVPTCTERRRWRSLSKSCSEAKVGAAS
ncbi:hypothetical protein [Nostoc sp.]|uniref:hypothetical protein n=1 Tax=Nostoc sp. TaxID=1180 RepID=UPI002FFABDE9